MKKLHAGLTLIHNEHCPRVEGRLLYLVATVCEDCDGLITLVCELCDGVRTLHHPVEPFPEAA